ncbi:MAG: alpha/beta hydrolase [Pseudomonadota bacterium]
MFNPIPFEVAHAGHRLRADSQAGDKGRFFMIHGAGTASREGFLLPRTVLAERGIGSSAFDCIGHGATGGSIADSSLHSRTLQAAAVFDACGAPPAAFAASMGAYNAIRLTQLRQIDALVLCVPGVFTPEAYDVPFGPDFSTVIRRERSWVDTDAWDILAGFTGHLLVIAAEHDAVIPREIPERLVAAAGRAKSRRLEVVQGGAHRHVISRLAEEPPRLKAMMDLIEACLGL